MKHVKPVAEIAHELTKEELVRLQRCLTETLGDIDRVCRENGLNYFLGGGTALGAVRHGGFIPWDDDMDLCMPRADFDRFTPLFRRLCGDRYWVHSPNDASTHGLTMARVRRRGTSVRDRNDVNETEGGAFVDIFIYENTFDNPVLRMIHGFGSMVLGLLVSLRKFRHDRDGLLALVRGNPEVEAVVRRKAALGALVAWLPLDFCVHLANGWNRLCHDTRSRYVTCPTGRKRFFGQLGLRSEFCSARDILFDGVTTRVFKDVEHHLTRLYGPDYMTPPPASDRETHVFLTPFRV